MTIPVTPFALFFFGSLLGIAILLAIISTKNRYERVISSLGMFAFSSVTYILLFGSFKDVKPIVWHTIYPNQKNVTVTIKTTDGTHATVTPNISAHTLDTADTITLQQGSAIKKQPIDIVLTQGQGTRLDHLEYGTHYQQQTLFGKPLVTSVTTTNTLKAIYKKDHSNKTLDNMLK